MVTAAVKYGNQLNQPSLLVASIASGNNRLASWMIDKGVPVNILVGNRYSALHYSCNPTITKQLIQHGAIINQLSNDGDTPLMILASRKDATESLRILLSSGASVFNKNILGQNALQIAVDANALENARLIKRWMSEKHKHQ
jgi:hypothetical protein